MIVENIELSNFRNYERERFFFDSGINIIIGDNAQGKTNLLESIFYLTTAKSFRPGSDRDIVRFGASGFDLKANIYSAERRQKLRIVYEAGKKKQLYCNNIRLKTSSELSGKLTAVLFSPDELYIIKDGAAARRRLMDACISQLRPKYASALSQFRRAYEGKTRILKDSDKKPSLMGLLDEYNVLLARMSANIIYYRAYFAESLNNYAGKIHKDFSGGKEDLKIRYKTVSTIDDPKRKPSELFEMIMAHQKSHFQAEIQSGQCLTGAHKDDLEIFINGGPAKSFASQGQTRTAALSIKLAERQIHYKSMGEYPVLLLDDVLSELDDNRQNYILNMIKEGQIFITCCEDGKISQKTGGKIIKIHGGREV